jgi:CCR4-NOT transcription complex subunit 2
VSLPGITAVSSDARKPLGAIGNDAPSGKGKDEDKSRGVDDIHDPLEGMPPVDKWGLKGLRTLMNNYPDYNALTVGIDLTTLGLDLATSEYAMPAPRKAN